MSEDERQSMLCAQFIQMLQCKDVREDLDAECTLTLVQVFVGMWMVSMLIRCYKTYILFLVLLPCFSIGLRV